MQSANETEEAAEKVGRKLSIGSQKTLGDDFDGNGDGEVVVEPTAEDCHLSIESLDEVEEKLARKKLTKRVSNVMRVYEFIRSAFRVAAYVGRGFASGVSGIRTMSQWSSQEWREKRGEWWKIAKDVLKHYWVGTKLLATEVKVASKYVRKSLRGKTLSRRERRQLTRTTADIFRMVPMLIFLVIPFMELLLPVALTIFPNMLPSTFQDKLQKEENLKKKLRVKLEVASFLQVGGGPLSRSLRSRVPFMPDPTFSLSLFLSLPP